MFTEIYGQFSQEQDIIFKICTRCDNYKNVTEFYHKNNSKCGLCTFCKTCMDKKRTERNHQNPEMAKERSRRGLKNNPEKAKKSSQDWAKNNPKEYKEQHWKSYGIRNSDGSFFTCNDYEALLNKQNGVCAICETPSLTIKGLHVDHNHETGTVRWILCHHCNVMLGLAKDNPLTLRKAADMLEQIGK